MLFIKYYQEKKMAGNRFSFCMQREFNDESQRKPLCGFPYAVHMQFVIKLHTNLLAVICIIKTGLITNKVLLTL